MENKECYLVVVSSGEWGDNVKFNTGTVFLSLFSAEKELEKTKNYYTTETPCPVDLGKYGYFGIMSEEDEKLYNEWEKDKSQKEKFGEAWIETLTVEE